MPREPVRLDDWPGARSSTRSTCLEWHAPPSRASRPQHKPAIPARRRSRRRSLRFRGRSDRAFSLDTRLSQNAIAEPPGVLLRVNRHPDFLAGRGMFQQPVAALPGPDLDESPSLQLADHLGPGHLAIVNLPLGFVNAATGCRDRWVRFLAAVGAGTAREFWMALGECRGEPHFRELEPGGRLVEAD